MRFILAGIAFLISLVCFGLGALQIAQAQSADHVTVSGTSSSGAPLIVLPSDTLVDNSGAQQITITGDGPIVAVVGREGDVTGWVADTTHDRVVVDDATSSLVFEAEAGAAATAPNPLGSDLWYEEYTGENTLELQTSLPQGFAVLIASTGDQPAPSGVSMTWPIDGRAPWSGPLLVLGVVFLLVALGLLLWGLLVMRRGVRPRRTGADENPVALRPSTSPLASAEGPATQSAASDIDSPFHAAPLAKVRTKTDTTGPVTAVTARATPAEPQFDDTQVIGQTPSAADDAWAPPSGAWAAPPEPVSVPHDTAVDDGPAPAVSPAVHRTSSAESGTAGESESVAAPPAAEPVAAAEPAPAADPPAPVADPEYGIRTEQPPTPTAADTRPSTDETDDDAGDDSSSPPAPPTQPPGTPPAAGGDDTTWKRPRGRDRTSAPKRAFRLAPVLVVGALLLSGCSPSMWPENLGGAQENPTATPTSTIDQALLNEGAPLPAINDAQLTDILEDVRAVVAEADAAGNAEMLAARFSDAALEARSAVYRARSVDASLPAPLPFPTGPVEYAVPQATDTWPRTVFVVIEMGDAADAGAAPAAVMLQQATARDQYCVASLTQLAANVQLPEAAPMAIGAPGLDELAGTLVIEPADLAAAYGDVMLNGEASASAALFATENDTFLPQVGQAYRDQQLAAIDQAASRLEFSNRPTEFPPLGIGTLDGGAIVAISIDEVETFSARTQLATLSVSGRAAALAGAGESPYGFERIYTDQLLFYVPSAAAGGQVQFLGYSQTMTSARVLAQTEVTYG